VVSIVNADGTALASKISYTYEPFGNLATTTDTVGNRATITYDTRGRRLSLADPDAGTATFTYDVLGEMATRTNAKNQTTTYTHDLLGRPVYRTETDLTTHWIYDSCTHGVGRVCKADSNDGYTRAYNYDNIGRVTSIGTIINGPTYTVGYGYDTAGRISTIAYPSGFGLQRDYNNSGYLADIRLGGTSGSQGIYWQETAADAEGHITAETLGNGLTVSHAYSPLNGLVTQIQAGMNASVQNQSFTYDTYRNLQSRTDIYSGTTVAESYTDDLLNRLTGVTGTSNGIALSPKSISYDLIGNIVNKSDVGTYSYPAAGAQRPHAVAAIAGTLNGVSNPSFAYDGNGNLTSGAGRTVSWTSFNMAAKITAGANFDSYSYGPEHQRFQKSTRTDQASCFSAWAPGSRTTNCSRPQAAATTTATTWKWADPRSA
jgi:YD repeat-containing protein